MKLEIIDEAGKSLKKREIIDKKEARRKNLKINRSPVTSSNQNKRKKKP